MATKVILSIVIVIALMVPSVGLVTTDLETGYVPSDNGAQVDIITVYANQPPVADAGGPYYGDEGSTIQLDGSGTSDPDGDALLYYWDLDDDGLYDDSTQVKPSYTWSEDGTNVVRLWVYDGEYFDTDSATVHVKNLAPDIYSTSYVYTLTQESDTWTVPAVESILSPTDFYNFYSDSAHTGFELPYQSFVYLYRDIDDPSSEVSLFIIHDIDGDIGPPYGSPEAKCKMDLSGIPSGTYLAQSDDWGEFKINYPSAGQAQGRWRWWYNTDGGAIGGLSTSSSWTITIEPLLWDDVYTWSYYYAAGSNIDLDMNEPISISYSAQTEPNTVVTDEGTSITIGAFARDWGGDDEPLDYQIQWNDPSNPGATSSGTTLWDTLFTAEYTYYDDGPYYPLLTVTDSDGLADALTFTVLVNNIAPYVDAGVDLVVDEGTPLSFSGSFSDPGAYDTHTASWNWGDGHSDPGSVSEENVPPYSSGTVTGTHIFLDDGTYNVILEVQDDDGGTDQDTLAVVVSDLAPSAEFVWSPSPLDEGSPVYFTDLSNSYPDDITSWSWDFGGFGTSTLQSPQFTFMDDGVYTITLIVTDDDGSTDTISHYVAVLDLAPAAEFSWSPEPQDEGSPVQFTELSVSYPDVIVGFVWDFGDGGTSNQTAPSHMYGDNGIYPVTLVVTDDDGSIDTISYTVTIVNVAPDIEAGADQLTDEGTTISLAGYFSDLGWLDTHSATIDWGDGTLDAGAVSESGGSGTVSGSHTYGDNRAYTVTVTVTDDDGGVGYDTLIITVNNVAPAVEALSYKITDEGALISLDLATFTDPGWLDSHSAAIDWGDGTLDAGVVSGSSGSGTISGSHTYGDNGVYKVTVTVTDDDGGVGFDTLEITVNNLAPQVNTVGPYTIDENSPVTLEGHGTDPGSDDLMFTWNWGDGTSETVIVYYNDGMSPDPYPSPENNPMDVIDTVTHSYGDDGVFKVSLTVSDDDGDVDVVTTNVTVINVAPTVDPGGPYIFDENTPVILAVQAFDPGSDDLAFTWEFESGDTISAVHYNDGLGPDPYPSPDNNPMDLTDSAAYTYGDCGVFNVTLTVEDDDGGIIIVIIEVVVDNVAPTIVNIEAYMHINFTLRIAGEKWHSVTMYLYEDGSEIWTGSVTREPGDPDEQTATINNVKVDMTKTYTALVEYLPNDPMINGIVWGGNPVWVIMTFEDGSETWLHHTFNVRQSDWDSDHWNHIDPWEVDFASYFGGHNITFEATATDPGSDDLTFLWDFGDGNSTGPNTYYNNGADPDPYPSPEINPMTASDSEVHNYPFSGTYTVTLTVTDDDGGTFTITMVIEINIV